MPDFVEQLYKYKEPVWEIVRKYLPDKEPKGHYAMVRDYPERQGKYFRPALVLLSCELFSGSFENALPVASAMQLSEEWLLVHDDFEDHSLERRSTKEEYRPTLNMKHGDELAVNAGDALHIIMWKALGDAVRGLPADTGWKVFDLMYDILLTTTEGQYTELSWIREGKIDISEEEYYVMVDKKAGYYTVVGPLLLGALVAGVKDENVFTWIKSFGIPFGRAFQIRDDVLNLTVDTQIQGKEKAGDILEGKRTIPLIHLLRNCTKEEKETVSMIYKKARLEKSSEDLDSVLCLMERCGSIRYADERAVLSSSEAIKIFESRKKGFLYPEAFETIRQGIEFVVKRDR